MLVGDTAYQERARWRQVIENTRETAQKALAHQAWQVKQTQEADTGSRIVDPRKAENQLGRPIMPQALISRLKMMNGFLQFTKNNLGNWAVLYPAKERQDDGGEKEVLRMAAWFENTIIPEFDILHPEYDAAWDSEKRDKVETLKTVRPTPGWRNVLSKLLKLRLISIQQITENFGYAHRKNWRLTVRPYGG